MNHELYTIGVYLWIDEKCRKLSSKPALPSRVEVNFPSLTPAEIITIEVLGETLNLIGTRAIWRMIDQHWRHFFPRFPQYKTFARLCNACGMLKAAIVADFATLPHDYLVIDGVPMPLCKYIRANRCQRLPEYADFGYCAAKDEHYMGVKGHCVINERNQIVTFSVTNPKVDEREAALDFIGQIKGLLIADKGYIGEKWQETMRNNGIEVMTRMRKNMTEKYEEGELKIAMRYRKAIETTFSTLIEHFGLNRNTAHSKDNWIAQLFRKLIAYNLTISLNA
jgi:hypothetical protein